MQLFWIGGSNAFAVSRVLSYEFSSNSKDKVTLDFPLPVAPSNNEALIPYGRAAAVAPAVAGNAMTLTSAYDFAKGTTATTESYAANGVAPTPVQMLYAIHQMLMDFGISGTALTVKKLNNSTTAFVVTLNDATSPTAAART